MYLPTTREMTGPSGRLPLYGAVLLLFFFVAVQGALSAHAATHNNSAVDQCSTCHTAGSSATPTQVAAILFTVDYSSYVPGFSLAREIPSFNIPSYLAGRSPPTSL